MKIYSWNLNGIRACARNGFVDWLGNCGGDVVMLQEVRAEVSQMAPEWLTAHGYSSHWFSAQKKGYSGVGIYTKKPVAEQDVIRGLGIPEFDAEGRVLGVVVDGVAYFSCYFPNSQEAGARLAYKIAFCDALLSKAKELEKNGVPVVIGGDFNIAHKPIDLENPKQNEKNPGYLPAEREWFTKFLGEGFLDTFRVFDERPEQYTWWSNRFKSRERNVGWRIDYHCCSESLRSRLKSATIHQDVMGSDHCPVGLLLG